MTKERVNAGFQIGFHAIGDKGVQMALNAFAAATQTVQGQTVWGRVSDPSRPSEARLVPTPHPPPTSACASSTRKSPTLCR